MLKMEGKNFFDTSILNKKGEGLDKGQKIEVHLSFDEISKDYFIFLKKNDIRLTSNEILELIKNSNFDNNEKDFLEYFAHKIIVGQTMYKILNDIQIIFSKLKLTGFKILLNKKEISFSKELFVPKFVLYLNNESEVILDVLDISNMIFGLDKIFVFKDNLIYEVEEEFGIGFFKQIYEKNNKFTIESYLKFKGEFLKNHINKLKIEISDEVKNLDNITKEEKIPEMVFEIDKTNYFIVGELKYRIEDKTYPLINYIFKESLNSGKPNLIKTIYTKNKLIKYISDIEISQFIVEDLFLGNRTNFFDKNNSFKIKLPIGQIEYFDESILPKIKNKFEVIYKNNNQMSFSKERIFFELENSLKRNLNLFEFSVKFKIGENFLSIDKIKQLLNEERNLLKLENGDIIKIENVREIKKWMLFLRNLEFKRSENKYKGDSKTALELDEFLKSISQKNMKSNEEFKNLIIELKDRKPVENIELPKETKNILRDYQKEGVYWMNFLKKYGFGGILADEMGLGKTLQSLCVLNMNLKKEPHLVVCPKSLIYNWENEIKKYFPNMSVCLINKNQLKRKQKIEELKKKNYDIVITSYSMIQKDFEEYIKSKISFNYMLLDEAQIVKNMKTLSSKAVRTITAKRKVILSGTPLENNLEELYGTFEIIMPNYLGTKIEFKREYISKIERNDRTTLEMLQAKIRPFILRRTKKQVLKELPDKQIQVVYNQMTNKQTAVYSEVLNRIKIELDEIQRKGEESKSRLKVLSALLKLRQICNHPLLIDKTLNEEEISAKFDQFNEILREIIESDEKVLIFSQFTSMLDIMETEIKNKKIRYLRLDGQTQNRQELVDKFNEEEDIKVFFISLKAGGIGLNLTSANNVIIYDPWWNPQAENQAIDRTHRIGQKKSVNVYKFITKNSIEEKILKLQERKGDLFENIVNLEENGFMKKLDWEDLMELFE